MAWWWFPIGFLIGAIVGFVTCCLCVAAGSAEPHDIPRGVDPWNNS